MVPHYVVNSTWVRRAQQLQKFIYLHSYIDLRLMYRGKLLVMLQKKRKCQKFSSFTYLCVRRRIKRFLVQLCNSLVSYHCY